MLEKVRDNLFKINKNQYLKINKKGNGEVVAPYKDPETKKLNWNNIILTGGTLWGLVKAILIVAFLLFMLWRYNVEVEDCVELRKVYDPNTGCIAKSYFNQEEINLKEVNHGIGFSLSSPTEDNDRPLP